MKLSIHSSGDFSKTIGWLKRLQRINEQISKVAPAGAQRGVRALSQATPKDSARAAASWAYKIESSQTKTTITWTNSDIENGFPVVIMLQYGHGTGTGGYVQGQDFINPAIRPIFDEIAKTVWKAVTTA